MKKPMENKFSPEQFAGRKTYQFMNLRPGGNDTTLIKGIVSNLNERKKVNDLLMSVYPNVEQVGFINLDPNACELIMAGGEFCGNATRSTAYLALEGKPGELNIKVSGVKNKLRAGVTENGEAFAQMPIYQDVERVIQDPTNPKNNIVYMEGITQYVNWDTSSIEGKSPDDIKKQAMELIREKGLDTSPAAGVMYVKETSKGLEIAPVVYVRDIDTLFFETACGSGTTAVGLTLAKQTRSSIKDMVVYQPSGLPIKVSIDYDGKEFTYAQIQGPIETLKSGILSETKKGAYIIERVTSPELLVNILNKGNLIALYKESFSKAPYFEQFEDEEIGEFFTDYVQNGLLFLAQNKEGVIGFGAAVPLSSETVIVKLANQFGIDTQSAWYMADLGVSEQFREVGIGKQLVEARLREIPKGTTVLMRTSVDNIASLSLYRSIGFTEVEGMIQEVEGERIDGTIKKDTRVFLSKIL